MFDIETVRADFPILQTTVRGRPLVYLDNAATTQKPRQVLEALDHYYRAQNSNVHRGLHSLSEQATQAYEAARDKLARWINAPSTDTVIFTRGTTEAINLVAYSWGRHNIVEGDEILLTLLEHHSNIVPWQLLAQEKGATLRYVDVDDSGRLRIEQYEQLLSEKTKLVALNHISNALGTINPIQQISQKAHAVGARVLIDGAQGAPHLDVDVQAIDCDFYAFSGHKMAGPTGVGVLYGRRKLLEEMPPFLGGGEMIREVNTDHSTWNDLPWKFEAGTPNIAQAIGLGAAVDYLSDIGLEAIRSQEHELVHAALSQLADIAGVTLWGPPAQERAAVVAFSLDGIHPHDISQILDQEGLAIRAGHHCAQLLMKRFEVSSTARASFYFYNTLEEVEALVRGIRSAQKFFSRPVRT